MALWIHNITPDDRPDSAPNLYVVKINRDLGAERQRATLSQLGLLDRPELGLAGAGTPLFPEDWNALSAATISYGHGIAVSPVAFLSAFAVFANDGKWVAPRVFEDAESGSPQDVFSKQTSDAVLAMLVETVRNGTGRAADMKGYQVAGKTGTAEKPIPGGYAEDRNLTSFAAVFPADRPQYAILIVLDEAKAPDMGDGSMVAETAATTAAPVAGRVISRAAPLLGVAPQLERSSRQAGPDRSHAG